MRNGYSRLPAITGFNQNLIHFFLSLKLHASIILIKHLLIMFRRIFCGTRACISRHIIGRQSVISRIIQVKKKEEKAGKFLLLSLRGDSLQKGQVSEIYF